MTTWISHRGYCAYATENTQKSFDAAIDFGFTHLETDLRCSKDSHIVLSHDDSLKRTAGIDRRISQMSRLELEQVTLAKGERLLFLDEFFQRYRYYDWIFDIKGDSAHRTIAGLTAFAEQGAADFLAKHVRFLCWLPDHRQLLTKQLPNPECLANDRACYRIGLGALLGVPKLAGIAAGETYALPPRLKGLPLMNRRLVANYHAHGAKVIGYLPRTMDDHYRVVTSGADEILTDHANYRPKIARD